MSENTNNSVLYVEEIPRDGTWVKIISGDGKSNILQFDKAAFGGKGCWFNEKGHAKKLPDQILGWEIYLQAVSE